MAATYTTTAKVRNLTNISSTSLIPDATITEFINHCEYEIDRWYIQDNIERSNLIFCANSTTETAEIIDYRRGSSVAYTKYPHIYTITTLGYATGDSTYETKSEGRTKDYYMSDADKQYGCIRILTEPPYERGGIQITYKHGLTCPGWVSELCTYMTAKMVYNAVLQADESIDTYAARIISIENRIKEIKESVPVFRRGTCIIGV